jgi:uncharacterized membrane protein
MAKKLGSVILLMLLCGIIASSAQLFLKLGTKNLEWSFAGLASNFFLILGIITYAVGAIIMVLALKKGDLSLVYPLVSLSFVWVSLLSVAFVGESLALLQWLGILLIISGVSFVSWGAKHA